MMYDPGADALARYPEFTVRHRELGGIPAATSRRQHVILIDKEMLRRDQRCALAHELAHLDLAHSSPICEGKEERHADELAAARMIPLSRLADALTWALSFDEVADELGVTTTLARRRILALTGDEKAWIEWRIGNKEESA